jgi:exopolysaccharide biosynthesis operon protein EpsL
MKNFRVAAAIAAVLCAPAAHAFYNDRLEVFADETMTWDSNVFRLSRSLDPQASTGSGSRGDRFNVHSLGASLDVPYSLQRFQAGYTWFATRYNRFSQLDFNGHNAHANWLWAITPHLTGDAGISDSKSLANFAIFGGTARDLVTARQAYVNGTWALTPSYLLFAGATRDERTHDDPARKVDDLTSNAAEVRFSYVNAADNRIGLSYRREKGESPEQLFAGTAFNNAYSQDSVGVVGRWTLSGLSRLDGRVDYVKRRYDQFAERDYKGPSFRVTHTWLPTGKLTFATTVYREIAPLDDIQTAFVLTKGITIRPRWDVTAKIAVQGSFDYSRWDYNPVFPITTAGGVVATGPYRHNIRTGGVSVAWRPYTRVLVQAGLLREVRTSTLFAADYEVNVATLEARIGF